ncbi:DUF4124 domain-containing protein [Pseudoalteromonas sp. YIC-656]|uniref:DUF4124 domain-containing protein n=1 Tax=Pseudoalteromonas pernae TaxID=3118054 RepID=UPI003242510F
MKYPIFLVGLIALMSLPSQAAVYKCVVNGVPTFSQLPCGKDAQVIDVRYSKSTNDSDDSAKEEDKPGVTEVDSFLADQKIDREIAMHQKNIQKYETMLAEQLAQIENINQATANYLGAKSIEDAKKQQASLANLNFKSRIENEQQAITKLQEVKKRINEAAAESNQPL